MQKSKLGVSVGLVGAVLFFCGVVDSLILLIIVSGYVLLVEENAWLKRTSVKAVILFICFSVLSVLIGLLPDIVSTVGSIANIWGGSFSLPIISKIVNAFESVLDVVKCILFLILGFKALNQRTLIIPFVDSIVSKYM